jgi:hypothetical protein
MKRFMLTALLAIGSAAAACEISSAQEEVKVVDHLSKKESQVKGTIESESPEGIKIKVGNEVRLVPAVDVKYVLYKLGDVKSYEYNPPFGKEDKALIPGTKPADKLRLLTEARTEFETLAPKFANNPNAARFMQFKAAQMAALLARDDIAQTESAIKVLRTYTVDQTKGWELVPALKLLAELQESKGDIAEARKTYVQLGQIANLPKEMKVDADLLVAQMSLRSGQVEDAEKILDGLRTTLSPSDPQRAVALVYLSQAHIQRNQLNDVEADLKSAITNSSEPQVRTLAHNSLGDYYRKKGMTEEAFWEYLRVDAMYSQDRSEQAKALYYLSKLFVEVKKDKVKSQECLERLKTLEGTEFARRAATEK